MLEFQCKFVWLWNVSRLLVKLAKGWWKAKVGVIWTFFFGCGSSVLGIEFQVHARACECVVMGSEILEVLGNQSQRKREPTFRQCSSTTILGVSCKWLISCPHQTCSELELDELCMATPLWEDLKTLQVLGWPWTWKSIPRKRGPTSRQFTGHAQAGGAKDNVDTPSP